MKTLKIALALVVSFGLAACTGAGTSGTEAITKELQTANPNSVFVYRDTGFSGSGALMKAFLNGKDMGNIGVNESFEFQAPRGTNTLEVRYTGLAALNEPGKTTFQNDGKTPNFFVVSQRTNLLGATIIVVETTAESYGTIIKK